MALGKLSSTLITMLAEAAGSDAAALTQRILPMLSPLHVPQKQRGGRSRLNPDGQPFRVCGRGEQGVSLLLDAFWYIDTPRLRLEHAREALFSWAHACNAAPLKAAYSDLLARLMYAPGCSVEDFEHGLLLLDIDPTLDALGFLMDVHGLLPMDAYTVAEGWLAQLVSGEREAQRLLRELYAAHYSVHSLGYTHSSQGLRAKLVVHRPAHAPQRCPDIFGGAPPELALFLAELKSLQAQYEHDTFLTLELDVCAQRLHALSLEVAPAQSPAPWLALLNAHSACAEPIIPLEWQHSPQAHARRIGMCQSLCSPQLTPMITYAPAGLAAPQQISRAQILERIHLAIHALLERQSAQGCWDDYRLPFGSASFWTTAFVALTLRRARPYMHDDHDAAARGARWLEQMKSCEVGWGLGPYAAPDTHTSALVLRLFDDLDHPVSCQERAWLARMWSPDGGFRSSDGPLHWADVHPCVTALAWPALTPSQASQREEELHEYLARFARTDGKWQGYWWRTHHFSSYHHICLLADLGCQDEFPMAEEVALPGAHATSFETAWALGVAVLAGHRMEQVEHLLHELLGRQQVDGSWPGGRDLRITEPGCARPWEHARGQLMQDHCCMSTASALWVLLDLIGQL